jgi:hypothetical protein
MRVKGDEATVLKTSNPDCPACNDMRQHNPDEWEKYHPLAGTGFSAEHGTPKPKDYNK